MINITAHFVKPASTNQISKTPLPSASAQTAPLLQPQPSPSEPHTSVSPKNHVQTGSKQIRVKCIHCGIEVNKKNLLLHIKRKHTDVKHDYI